MGGACCSGDLRCAIRARSRRDSHAFEGDTIAFRLSVDEMLEGPTGTHVVGVVL